MSDQIKVPDNVLLKVIDGPDQGKEFKIANKTISIGRADACDFTLTDKYTSNKHCQVVFRNDHFTVIDLGSLNKTKVNNKVYVQKNLRKDDVISIGKTKLAFNWDDMDETVLDGIEDILASDDDSDAVSLD
jgi:pSer/pThr/pTyr-binding forkhead associated (FHA) protein